MVKIFNLKSKTLNEEAIKEISNNIDSNKHTILLNENIEYEIIDLETLKVLKSKNSMMNKIKGLIKK